MTDSNRTRVSLVRETTLGQTPGSPKMRTLRMTGESLRYAPQFVQSDEIRADRMSADPVKIGEVNGGGINVELFYPASKSATSELLASAMLADWTRTPEWDNAEGSGSISAVATGSITVANQAASGGFSGVSVKSGHLVRLSGFTNAGNNGVFKVTAGAATSLTTSGLVAEASPPSTARVKVVGFEGGASDIGAAVDGLTAASLDFTTLGLTVGQWIKIGGATAAQKFNAAANVGYARIVGITATKLTLDNLPSGWTTETAAAGKAIRVFFGDVVKNGTALIPLSVERSFLGQAVPTHILQAGMCVNTLRLDFSSERIATGAFELVGMSGKQGPTAAGATLSDYLAAPTGTAMSSNVAVGRIGEANAAVVSPNFVRTAGVSINNNLRMKTAVGNIGAVDIGVGECEVAVNLETYFGDNALLQKLLNGTATSVNLVAKQGSQAVVFDVPRLTLMDGAPSAGGKNQDVTLPLQGRASYDPTTGAHIVLHRLEYVEG